MAIRELFDLDLLRSFNVTFIQLHELRKHWNGQLDMLLYFRDDAFPAVSSLQGWMGSLRKDTVSGPLLLGCGPEKVELEGPSLLLCLAPLRVLEVSA